jgi:muramoyltetrapeptide carboxypeptidase LdcA involved in peptidoglycan recycling
VISRKYGVLTENSGQGSRHSSIMNSDDSLHVVGCVSSYKKKERVSSLTTYLESQKQYFEEVEQSHDETQYLKAENQKRTEEMLQKAKEEFCKR